MNQLQYRLDYESNAQFFSGAELRLVDAYMKKKSSVRDMSATLFISVHTVQTHRSRMIEKVRGKSFHDVIQYCMLKGILREV